MALARALLKDGAPVSHAFVGDEPLRGDLHDHLCWPGNTPLAEAIRAGHPAMIRLLVDAGVDPNAPVATSFGTNYPGRVKDRPLTWWMRFALAHEIDDEGNGSCSIRPGMEEAGRVLLALGSDPSRGAITNDRLDGPGMDTMMAREGLQDTLSLMQAAACRDHLCAGTDLAPDSERTIERL